MLIKTCGWSRSSGMLSDNKKLILQVHPATASCTQDADQTLEYMFSSARATRTQQFSSFGQRISFNVFLCFNILIDVCVIELLLLTAKSTRAHYNLNVTCVVILLQFFMVLSVIDSIRRRVIRLETSRNRA